MAPNAPRASSVGGATFRRDEGVGSITAAPLTASGVSVTFTFTPREYRRALRTAFTLHRGTQALFAVSWLALVIGLYLWVVYKDLLGHVLVVGAGGVFLALAIISIVAPLDRARRDSSSELPRTIVVTPDGVTSTTSASAAAYPWSALGEPLESARLLVLPVKGGGASVFIPKRALTSSDELTRIRMLEAGASGGTTVPIA
jgi:hypothetical protein